MKRKLWQRSTKEKSKKTEGRTRLPLLAYVCYLFALSFALTGVTYSKYISTYTIPSTAGYQSRMWVQTYPYANQPTTITITPDNPVRTWQFAAITSSNYSGTDIGFWFDPKFSAGLPAGTKVYMADSSVPYTDLVAAGLHEAVPTEQQFAFPWVQMGFRYPNDEANGQYRTPGEEYIGIIKLADSYSSTSNAAKFHWVVLKIDCSEVTEWPETPITYTIPQGYIYGENVD